MVPEINAISFLLTFASGSVIHDVYLTTPDSGSINTWTNPSDIYLYYKSLSGYGFVEPSDRSFSFKVKAAGDAHILLSSATDIQTDVYIEIAIGGDGNAKIHVWYKRESDPVSGPVAYTSSNILSDVEYRQFTILWPTDYKLVITDGTGTALVDWTSGTSFSVRGIGIRSGWGHDADWILTVNVQYMGHYSGRISTYGNMTAIQPTMADINHVFRCGIMCSQNDNCLGFNYDCLNKECQLIAGNQSVVTTQNDAWLFWTKCLRGKDLCL